MYALCLPGLSAHIQPKQKLAAIRCRSRALLMRASMGDASTSHSSPKRQQLDAEVVRLPLIRATQLAIRCTSSYIKAKSCVSVMDRETLRSQLTRAGGFALALASLSFSFTAPNGDLRNNLTFVAGFWGWFVAQVMKVFTYRYKKGEWNLKAVVDSGGMPSSHSSMCVAVTTSLAMQYGFESPLFPLSLCFTLIVMYDAAGVRRHAGNQAEVLNVIVKELMDGHPVSEVQLKEVLGHTPLQVFMGAVLGMLCGYLFGR